MKTLLLLLLSTLTLTAQTDDVYLYVRSVDMLTNKLALINTALGYPNPATKTERAIDYKILSNGTNAIIRIDISAVWSPKAGRYVDWADKVKDQLTKAQWDMPVVDTLSELQAVRKTNAPVARITGRLLRQVGELME